MTILHRHPILKATTVLALLAATACAGGQTFDDGADELSTVRSVNSSPSDSDAGNPIESATASRSLSDVDAPNAEPFISAETWTGHLVGPNDGLDDSIRIEFSEGRQNARLLFGTFNPPPRATDPMKAYPPEPLESPEYTIGYQYAQHQGYVYAGQDIVDEGERVRFTVFLPQLWSDWCALQTSYPDPNGTSFGCMQNAPTTWGPQCYIELGSPPQAVPRDCGYMVLCGGISPCVCDADGCRHTPEGHRIELDLTLKDVEGEAALFGQTGERTAKLKRE